MAVRRRFVLTGLALAFAVYIGILFWNDHRRAGLVGLNDQPCTAEGRSVTGSDLDDWATLCAWREENRRLAAAGIRPEVVMIGDSLTERWPGNAPDVMKRGVGGQTSAQALLRFRQDALSLRPRIVHILVGSNDLLGLGGPFTLEEFEGNVLDMAELAKFHGETVILGTIPPMRDYTGFQPGASAMTRLNTALRRLAADHGLILADYHAALVRPDGTMREELFLGDGIHLTPEGYEIVQAVFDKALSEARSKSPRE